jgi:acetyl-CoA carboxylase biotin carboxylase subunit
MVSGYDLVREQILLALTGEIQFSQADIEMRGAAIEARVLAEDPENDFLPTSGLISYLKEPGGPGVRIDSSLYQGMNVTADYDSLLSKIITWGSNRQAAIDRMKRAIKEYQIGGLKTDLDFLIQILASHPYQLGQITTSFLDDFSPPQGQPDESLTRDAAVAAALHIHQKRNQPEVKNSKEENLWRQTARREQVSRA